LTKDGALELLKQAGYDIETNATTSAAPESTRGRISKDGIPLSLVIGVAANDPTAIAVANTAADQWRTAGIAASVEPLDPAVLYADALPNNRLDAIVGWHRAGGDLATELASRYGCTALAAAPTPGPTTPAPITAASAPTSDPGAPVPKPNNITGVCDPALQPRIDAALIGHVPISDVISVVEPKLWDMATVLPILQDSTIVAAGPRVENVSLTGAVPVGIVADAGRWVKMPP
jgi:ABC-type transport system substrate-binding protein